MDESKKLYLGKPRQDWVHACAKVLIASTLPYARFVMDREGYLTFERRSLPMFKRHVGIHLTSSEMRWIWGELKAHIASHEAHLKPLHERMSAEAHRAGTHFGGADALELDVPDTDIDIRTDVSTEKSSVH